MNATMNAATASTTSSHEQNDAQAWNQPIDWEAARRHLLRCVRARAMRLDESTVEDLAHEALIRAHRTLGRGERPANWDAFLSDVAKKTVIDHVRSRQRWARLVQAEGEQPLDAHAGPDLSHVAYAGDPIERLRFLLGELFRMHAPEQVPVLEARLAGKDWSDIEDETNVPSATLRQRWKRALDRLRKLDEQADAVAPLVRWIDQHAA